jgi:hypothetical protein
MNMTRVLKTMILPVLGLALAACGSGTPTNPTASNVTIKADQDPVTAATSTDTAYKWAATVNLTLTEDAGVGLTVAAVTGKIEAASGGIVVVQTNPTISRLQVRASGNRVTARGSLTLALDFLYTHPDAGRESLATITFSFYDDNGYSYTQSVQVKVV